MDLAIVRLQVQTRPVKAGQAPLRTYDPSAIESVPRVQVGPDGVIGLGRTGERIVDAHHIDHRQTRDARGNSGVTILGTGDYAVLRARFGDHVVEGVAGETILLDVPDGLAGRSMPESITVHAKLLRPPGPPSSTQTQQWQHIRLAKLRVADPCVEFSRFCLGLPATHPVDDEILSTLEFLDHGRRGYRAVALDAGFITLGDAVEIPDAVARRPHPSGSAG